LAYGVSPRWPSSSIPVLLMGLSLTLFLSSAAAESVVDSETYDFSIAKGLIEFGKGRYDKAEALFERASKAKPGDFDASDYLGQTWLRLKKYEAAEKIFRQLVDANPGSGRALLGLGIAQSNLGKYKDALTSLSAAEKAAPDNPLVYYYQGLVYHQLQAFNQSPALFSRAMALSPDLTPAARYYTGVAHYQLGQIDEAQKDFEAAIASGEPESELARSAREFLEHRGAAPKGPRRWDLSLSVTGAYDSNVVLLPLGTQPPGGPTGISQQSDWRVAFYARGEFRPIQTNTWTVGTTYGFYQSIHRVLSTFNVQDQSPSVFVQRQLGIVQARVQYVFDYVKVGGAPYLISQAVQPMLTVAEGVNKFTQFQFRYQYKAFQDDLFPTNSTRDAINWLAGVTQYVYFSENTGYLRAGYTYDTDNTGGGSPAMATPGVTTGADWAYKAHRLSASLGVPPLLTIKPNLAFDYYRQNYENPNSFSPTGTTRRRDNIYFLTASLSRDITQLLSLALEYNYTRDQSNVPAFDYNRSIYSLTLNGRF